MFSDTSTNWETNLIRKSKQICKNQHFQIFSGCLRIFVNMFAKLGFYFLKFKLQSSVQYFSTIIKEEKALCLKCMKESERANKLIEEENSSHDLISPFWLQAAKRWAFCDFIFGPAVLCINEINFLHFWLSSACGEQLLVNNWHIFFVVIFFVQNNFWINFL